MKTVQAHREHMKEKLELSDGLSLTRFAINWVEADSMATPAPPSST